MLRELYLSRKCGMRRLSMEDTCCQANEQQVNPSYWQDPKRSFKKAFADVGISHCITENLLRYLVCMFLHKINSVHQFQPHGSVEAAFCQYFMDDVSFDSGYLHQIVFLIKVPFFTQNLGTVGILVFGTQKFRERFNNLDYTVQM